MSPPFRRRPELSLADRKLAARGLIDPETGELNARGEQLAEDRYYGHWDEDEDSSPHGRDA